MPFIKASDGVKIYYEEVGHGEPLILTYGLSGGISDWDTNRNDLSKSFRLILYESRGHGRSGAPADPVLYSTTRYVSDLLDLMNQLKIKKAHIGGQSFGAGIAVRFCIAHPERAKSLIITNSSSVLGVPLSHQEFLMRASFMKTALEKGMDGVARRALKVNLNYRNRLTLPNAKQWTLDCFKKMRVDGYVNATRVLMNMDYTGEALRSLKIPTLLIGATRDTALPSMRKVARLIKNSKFVIIKDVGHFANIDAPEKWNQTVSNFLNSL